MTRRYWDGEYGYVECEVLWSGRGGMPHEVANRDYWQQKQNALLNEAPGTKDFPAPYELGPRIPGADIPYNNRTPIERKCKQCGVILESGKPANRGRLPVYCVNHRRQKAA